MLDLLDAAFVELRHGTMIGFKDDDQDPGARVFAECVILAIDARQVEIRRRRANRKHWMQRIRLYAPAAARSPALALCRWLGCLLCLVLGPGDRDRSNAKSDGCKEAARRQPFPCTRTLRMY